MLTELLLGLYAPVLALKLPKLMPPLQALAPTVPPETVRSFVLPPLPLAMVTVTPVMVPLDQLEHTELSFSAWLNGTVITSPESALPAVPVPFRIDRPVGLRPVMLKLLLVAPVRPVLLAVGV